VIAYDPATETVPHTEKFAVARIRQIVGDDTINPKIKGFFTWTINHQVAARYQDRRVFAMGDAVRRHPPTNGAGLNISIADAFNLAWKLALHHGSAAGSGCQIRISIFRVIVVDSGSGVGQIIESSSNLATRQGSL
jgi:2,4-dichlorophenol 6-monooxygenase